MVYGNVVMEAQAAAALHVDLIPGTEVMRDVEGIHFAHLDGDKGIVLIPQPTDDPMDPLNWSKPWKYIVITCQFLYCFITVMSALAVAPMFPLLAEEFQLDSQQVSLITGVCVITLGYSNFIIVPFSNIFGRRMTCIVFSIFVIATSIWEAVATSYSSLLAARALNGVATATNESLMMQVVADMFFLHERGFWTGIYFTAYFLGLFIGPVISGNIANAYGWRSFFWLSTGLAVFNFVLLLITFPETKFRRDFSVSSDTNAPSGNGTHTQTEKVLSETQAESGGLQTTMTASTALVGKGRPGRWQFLPLKPDSRWMQFLVRDIFTPLHAFAIPIIFWAGLMVAGSANTLLLWNLTESALLAAPPFNWNAGQVGYSNFAFVVGGVIGLVTAGPFSDWIARRMTVRNDGIREAEMRLVALIPFVILSAVGIVVGSLGYLNTSWGWAPAVVVGYGFTGLCVTTLPTIAIAYAIDCYKPISGEIMVVATVLKNTQGFGMSYWVAPLWANNSFINPGMVQFGMVVGASLLGIPVYFFGKKLRGFTKNSRLHRMEQD